MGIATFKIKKTAFPAAMGQFLNMRDLSSMLNKMPYGTSIHSIEPLPIVGLFVEFEIKLHNDIFKDGAEIIDNSSWTRRIGFRPNGDIVEFNSDDNYNLEEVVVSREDVKKSETGG